LTADGSTIARQLVSAKVTGDGAVDFGPLKHGGARTIDLGAEVVTLLRLHRQHQRELMMANRITYVDLGLVFAREHGETYGSAQLGEPLDLRHVGSREFARLLKAANVRRVTFHGLRHTAVLKAGTPVHVVSQRLGHASPMMTLTVYAHALPSMQADAASRLNALLHG
jgi:integrase